MSGIETKMYQLSLGQVKIFSSLVKEALAVVESNGRRDGLEWKELQDVRVGLELLINTSVESQDYAGTIRVYCLDGQWYEEKLSSSFIVGEQELIYRWRITEEQAATRIERLEPFAHTSW